MGIVGLLLPGWKWTLSTSQMDPVSTCQRVGWGEFDHTSAWPAFPKAGHGDAMDLEGSFCASGPDFLLTATSHQRLQGNCHPPRRSSPLESSLRFSAVSPLPDPHPHTPPQTPAIIKMTS